MKKIFSLVMLAALMFSFTACGSTEKPESQIFEYEWEEASGNDFEGMNFNVYQNQIMYSTNEGETFIFTYRQDSPLGDELMQRLDSIEQNYNCNIEIVNTSNIYEAIVAGMNPADIMYTTHGAIRDYAYAGIIVPYDDYSSVIDCRDSFKWGSPNCLEAVMCKGTLYGLLPASWIGNLGGYYFPVVSNNTILTRNGLPNPHEYVENGEWTREKFIEVIVACASPSDEIYGIVTYPEWWRRMCVYSNGVRYAVKNADGTYSNGLESEAAIDGLNWGKTSLSAFIAANALFTSTDDKYFLNGSGAFTITSGEQAVNNYPYETALTDFSILPFPSNPVYNPYGNWAGYLSVDSSALAIPITTPNLEQTAIIMDEIFEPLGGIENEEDLIDYYTVNVFFKRGDAEVLVENLKNSEYGYWNNVDGEIFNIFGKIINASAAGTGAEAVERHASAAWEDIQEYVIPNKEAYLEYFGIDYFDMYKD